MTNDDLQEMIGGRLHEEDRYIVEMFRTAWDTWTKAQATVREQGEIVMSGGTAISNPSLAVAAQAHAQLLALVKELGLSPAARRKLKIDSAEPSDPAVDWLTPNRNGRSKADATTDHPAE